MYIETQNNPEGRLRDEDLTDGEWVEFSDGAARVRAEIGERLAQAYDHITIRDETDDESGDGGGDGGGN